jgi:D-alanine-D-alanine ligase
MPFDIAMPLLHGRNGEDGTFQGMFETLGVPYTGSSVLASSIGLDKAIQKTLFGACGIPVLPFTLASEAAWRVDATSVLSSLRDSRQLPLIIKPARLGSSIGISVARTEVELAQAVEYGFQYDTKVIVEPFHDGCLEINCAAFPELNLATSACERPLHTGDYLSFSDKYAKKSKAPAPRSAFQSRVLPADITEDLSSRISALTLAAYRAIEADGILRADFLVTDQQVYLNEVNTLPGSLALSLWSPLGIDPHTILSAYLQSALTKARSRNSKAMPRSARQFIDALASQKG